MMEQGLVTGYIHKLPFGQWFIPFYEILAELFNSIIDSSGFDFPNGLDLFSGTIGKEKPKVEIHFRYFMVIHCVFLS